MERAAAELVLRIAMRDTKPRFENLASYRAEVAALLQSGAVVRHRRRHLTPSNEECIKRLGSLVEASSR